MSANARWRPRSRPLGVAVSSLRDRKSTRLNSSHVETSYAVFCLKKKKIVGIGLVGVTQLAIWAILGGILFSGVSLFLASPEQAAVMSADMGELDMEGIMSTVMGINFFFFNDTATTEIYTLSLHDALPI